MTRIVTDKLAATVVEVVNLDELFPVPAFKGRIGLDVRIERGSLGVGKRVRLQGEGSEDEVQIVGIEMMVNPDDATVVRILCSKPRRLAIPTGKLKGWMISED